MCHQSVIVQHFMDPTKLSYPLQKIPPYLLRLNFILTQLLHKNIPTDTIVTEGYYHMNCLNPINFYPLIVYNRIIKNICVP